MDAAGPVVLRNCLGYQGDAMAYVVRSCANVQLVGCALLGTLFVVQSSVHASHCAFTGMTELLALGPIGGRPALRQQGGRLVLTACTLSGGHGQPALLLGRVNLTHSDGGAALVVEQGAEALLLGGSLLGGDGGLPNSYHPVGGKGGCGLQLLGATALGLGARATGGTGPGGNGQPICKDSASSVTFDATAVAAIASLSAEPVPDGTVELRMASQPGTVSLLLLGLDLAWVPLGPIGIGNVHCVPIIVLGQFVTPASGTLAVPMRTPAMWPRNLAVYAQFLALSPSGPLLATNPIVLLMKS
jgi:hypothetical protein